MAKIATFLDQYSSRGTRHSYATGVNAFLSFVYQYTRSKGKRISPEDRLKLETLAETYLTTGRDYTQDLINFSLYCDNHYAPTSGRRMVAVVREFLSYHDVELSRKDEKKIRNKIPNGGPVSEEADLTRDLLQKLLNTCDIRMKALILVLLTSGMRIGEVTAIHDRDIVISEDKTYGTVTLRGVSRKRGSKLKNRHSRVTFINGEAVKALLQWYEVRDDYIKRSCARSRNRWTPEELNDGRVFPFGIPSLGESLRTALKHAKLFTQDEETGRSLIHFHLFRKYFITTMTDSGIPEKYVDFYAGHLDELDRAYQKQTKEKLLAMYLKGEPYLRVYDTSAEEIVKTKEEIKDTKEKVRDLQLDHLMTRAKFEEVERQNAALQERLKQVEKVKIASEQAELLPEYQAMLDRFKTELIQMQEKKKR